jgi:hypothetical protein
MVQPRKTTLSGGILLALSMLVGAVVGVLHRQASIGFLWGFGVGVGLVILVWLIDRFR